MLSYPGREAGRCIDPHWAVEEAGKERAGEWTPNGPLVLQGQRPPGKVVPRAHEVTAEARGELP